jgi:hypothetical protein
LVSKAEDRLQGIKPSRRPAVRLPAEFPVLQAVVREKAVEAAAFAAMGQRNPRNVERDGTGRGRDALHLYRRHEQEFRLIVDEAGDQPGAGDPVDDRPRPRHPLHLRSP